MKLFTAVHDDAALLPHFVRHYARLGISRFHIVASPNVAQAVRTALAGIDSIVEENADAEDALAGSPMALDLLRRQHAGEREWVAIVDLDEFLDGAVVIADELDRAEAEDATVVRARMVDRVASDGGFPPIEFDTDLWATFPRECALTRMLQGSVDHKGVLVRGHLEAAMAHHEFAGERVATRWLRLHHFKWNAAAQARVRTAMTAAREIGVSWWIEYERVLHHIETHGRIRWEEFPPPD